jgi:hypothetical protein
MPRRRTDWSVTFIIAGRNYPTPSFPFPPAIPFFAFMHYFGSDLWRSPSNRCGPCEFSMFSMTCGRNCESDALQTATPATRLLPKVRRELHASPPSNRDASYTCAGAGCDHGPVRYGAAAAGCRMPGCCWFRQPRHRKSRRKIAGPNDDCKA